MFPAHGSILPLRSAVVKFSLITLALAALTMQAHATCTTSGNPAVTTCTSSAGITVSSSPTVNASFGSSNVVSGITGSVTNISLKFTSLDLNNLNAFAVVLVPPSASGLTALDLLSGLCGFGTEQMGNSTFTLADTLNGGVDNTDGMMPALGVSTCPSALSGTYLPSDWYPGQDTFTSPGPGTSYNSAGIGQTACNGIGSNVSCGSYNFSSFGETGSSFNGTWNLYIACQATPCGSGGSLGSWTLAFTGSSLISTTTTVSATPNGMSLTSPVYTKTNVDGQSTTGTVVTLKATISPNPGGGTVTFYDSTTTGTPGTGSVIASGVALVSGTATTTFTFPGTEEGARSISATYSPATGYLGSSNAPNTNATVLTVNYPYNPSGTTYCNGPVTVNTNSAGVGGTAGFPYPSELILSGVSGTIESVTVTLNGLQVEDPNFMGFLLQAPNGTGYEFMSWADGNGPGGSPASLTNTTVVLADGGSGLLQTNSQDSDSPQSCTSSAPCKPADDYVQIDPSSDDTFPSPPSPFSGPTSVGKPYPTGSSTFTSQFGGAGANGTWLLYLNNWLSEDPSNNSSLPYGQIASWCVNLTMQANAHATTTALAASPNPATITSGTTTTTNLTATVTVTDGTPFSDNPSPGSVTFVDGSTTLGTANITDSGVATLSGATLTEGTHQIVASYSGTSSGTEFGISSATLDLRVNKQTTTPTTGSGAGPFTFCNTGTIVAPATNYDYGAALPYPSNIFVTNLPGTVKATTVTLNDFTTRDQGDLMSLLVGPGGNNLDFFSLTGSNVGTAPTAFNLTFEDGGSAISGNLTGGGPYEASSKNTSIKYPQCAQNATLCGTQDVGPQLGSSSTFTPTNEATSAGSAIFGNANLAGVFGGGTASTYNPNGTWSLYIDDGGTTGEGEDTSITGGWCVNITVNLPNITFSGPGSSTFTQGGTGSLPAVTITNTGIDGNGEVGSLGDPTQTTGNAMTVVDTLPTGLTYSSASGTDWTCSASGQTVTCTNKDTVAVGANSSALTINVNVSNTAAGPIGNNTVAVSDEEAANTPAAQSDSVTIDVPPTITSGSSTTFTVGAAGSFTVTATGYPGPTFTETGNLPSGVTLSSAGTLSGTPAAGTGGTYPITITAANGSTNANQSFTLTVNQPPAITSAAGTTFTVGTSGSFSFTATGYPTTMTYSVTAGSLPSGVTLSSAGLLSGTPAAATGGTYPVTITAGNGIAPAATQSFTLTVNQPPTFNLGATGGVTMNVGGNNMYLIFTTGYPTAAITESGALPSGITFVDDGNGHGTLSGIPAANTGGVYPVVFTANNGIAPNATLNYTITVNQPLAFTSTPSTTFTTGTTGLFTVTSSGYPAGTYSETGTLPNGVTLSSAGVLSGTPAAGTGGAYPIVINVNNGVSGNSQNFTLTVNQAPAITSVSNATFVTGTSGTFTVTTSGYPAAALSESGALPSGVTFTDNGNGTGTLAGTTATTGFFPITIAANNGVSPNASQSFALTVNLPQYTLTTAANPAAGGFVTPQSGTPFTQGTVVPLQATAATGYTFLGWTSAADPVASATSAGTTITVNGPESVTAQFSPYLVVNTIQDDAGTATNCTAQVAPGSNSVDSSCSLRDALLNATSSGAGNITFDSTAFATAQTITLTNGTLTIPTNTSILGATSGSGTTLTNLVTVSGGSSSSNSFAVFAVNTNSTLNLATVASIANLNIANGYNNNNTGVRGGGIFNGGTLALTGCTISGNQSPGGLGEGAGIYNQGALTLIGSTVSGNTATREGGGIYNYYNTVTGGTGTLNAIDSTIAGNSVNGGGASGGGIYNFNGTATLTGSTVSNNTVNGPVFTSGGGIYSNGTLTLANSVVAGNITTGTGTNSNADIEGNYTDNGGNQASNDASATSTINISLAPLGSYGGPTQTMVLLPGSPALCGGTLSNATAAGVTADQRGLPFDPLCPSGSVDSGAVESNYALSFSTEPPANAIVKTALSPAPVVTLTESGAAFAPATSTVTITDLDSVLSATGTNSAPLASGTATFSNLILSSLESGDTLTATLSLNPNLSPALNLVSPPSTAISVTSGIPSITSVSSILPQQTQTITISGSGFGTQAPYNGDSSSILIADHTGTPWYAGDTGNAITLSVTSWTDSQIVLAGFTGAYGNDGLCIKPGDQLYVKIWNPQTGNGPAYYPLTASSGTNTCDLVPTITSVSQILPEQTQTITISGYGFGTQSAYTGDSSSILLADSSGTPPWYAGDTGDAVTLAVSSWTDTQIVITGFAGQYGVDGQCLNPGDQLYIKVWNPQTGNGPAYYPVTAGSGASTCAAGPIISSVSQILPQQTQTITISGSGFGTQVPYNGDSSAILLADSTGTPWYAGNTGNAVNLSVTSWTDSQIVISGFTGAYGNDAQCIKPGDQLYVKVWNAQSGSGPAYYPITAAGGTNTCDLVPTITSVSQILPQQTQTITISGYGFGTQASYNGDSTSILLADSTGTPPWYAGNTGNLVTLAVSSWSDTQIVITGFTGQYGVDGQCLNPGDQLYIKVWNAQSGNGPAYYAVTAGSGASTCVAAPTISSVSQILPQQTQTITISGSGFGTQAPYNGDSSSILLADSTGTPVWYAGNTGNAVNLSVSSWSDSEIVITGFTGAYGTDGMCIKPGDQLYVKVWNAQSGGGPAYYPITASGGANTCVAGPAITSVSQILPQQTQTITINGSGFGTQAPYTGDSSSILFADPTGTPWYGGYPGDAVTLAVSSWTDSQIVITGFSGAYGTSAECIRPGDQVYVKVWNAQTGSGPAYYPITAASGTNTCP